MHTGLRTHFWFCKMLLSGRTAATACHVGAVGTDSQGGWGKKLAFPLLIRKAGPGLAGPLVHGRTPQDRSAQWAAQSCASKLTGLQSLAPAASTQRTGQDLRVHLCPARLSRGARACRRVLPRQRAGVVPGLLRLGGLPRGVAARHRAPHRRGAGCTLTLAPQLPE